MLPIGDTLVGSLLNLIFDIKRKQQQFTYTDKQLATIINIIDKLMHNSMDVYN